MSETSLDGAKPRVKIPETLPCKICQWQAVFIGIKRGKFRPQDFTVYRCPSCGFAFLGNPWLQYTRNLQRTATIAAKVRILSWTMSSSWRSPRRPSGGTSGKVYCGWSILAFLSTTKYGGSILAVEMAVWCATFGSTHLARSGDMTKDGFVTKPRNSISHSSTPRELDAEKGSSTSSPQSRYLSIFPIRSRNLGRFDRC